MFEIITDKLTTVHGGKTDAQLMDGAKTMKQYLDCNKGAQDRLQTGQAAAMTKAQGGAVTEGMTDMLAAGTAVQKDLAACAAKFPIK